MNNYGKYITPEQAQRAGDSRTIGELRRLAKTTGTCEVCDEPVWKLGGCGLCFTCTTGESDASDDSELVSP